MLSRGTHVQHMCRHAAHRDGQAWSLEVLLLPKQHSLEVSPGQLLAKAQLQGYPQSTGGSQKLLARRSGVLPRAIPASPASAGPADCSTSVLPSLAVKDSLPQIKLVATHASNAEPG